MAFQVLYRRTANGLTFATKAAALLDDVIYPALENFPRHENFFLKPRIQDALALAIAESLEGNELRKEDWEERVRLFGRARSRLKYLLVLTNSAVSRHHLTPTEAGKWQERIEELIRMISGLIKAAHKEN